MGVCDYLVLKDGLPIYSKNIDPVHGISHDATKFTMVSGFLSAISTFVDSMNNIGQVEEIQMSSDTFFFFQRTILENAEMLFITVASEVTAKAQAKWLLQTATTSFLDTYLEPLTASWDGNIVRFRQFDGVLQEILEESTHIVSDQTPMKAHEPETSEMPEFDALVEASSRSMMAKSMTRRVRGLSRFNRYRILKGCATSFRSIGMMDANMISTDNELPWASKDSWQTQGDVEDDCESMDEGITSGMEVGAEAPNEPDMFDNSMEMSQVNVRKALSSVLRGESDMSNASRFFTVSPMEKIPWKESIPSPLVNRILNTPWKKTLFKAINGRVSVRELANKLGVQPNEILMTCQEMADLGIITFKQ